MEPVEKLEEKISIELNELESIVLLAVASVGVMVLIDDPRTSPELKTMCLASANHYLHELGPDRWFELIERFNVQVLKHFPYLKVVDTSTGNTTMKQKQVN